MSKPMSPKSKISLAFTIQNRNVCTACADVISPPEAKDQLFKSGLRFLRCRQDLTLGVIGACEVCHFLRSVAEGVGFILEPDSEDIRLGLGSWSDKKMVFRWRAVNGDKTILTDKFIPFEVWLGDCAPIDYWGQLPEAIDPKLRPDNFTWYARNWLHDCLFHHDKCQRSAQAPLPNRVLEVSNAEWEPSLKLSVTDQRPGYYAALSYCWGENQPAKLQTHNLSAYLGAIDESTMPKTILDAVDVTRSLGIRYLWVDAYCIVQDSEADKQQNIGDMNRIYKDSLLTIAAAGSWKASEGFLNGRDARSTTFTVPVQDGEEVLTLALQKTPDLHYVLEPISLRAWTLQERLLPPRVLTFLSRGASLEWRCDSAFESNIGPVEEPYGDKTSLYSPLLPRTGNAPLPLAQTQLCGSWARIVEDYSSKKLTVSEDKLPAISAVAEEFARVFGNDYYAGLWGSMLISQLLWKYLHLERDLHVIVGAEPPVETPDPRASIYRSPSWSWASIDGRVSMYPSTCLSHPKLIVLGCTAALVNEAMPFGAVSSAVLTVQGSLKRGSTWDSKLHDYVSGQWIGSVTMDSRHLRSWNDVWCLQIGTDDSKDKDTEAYGSMSNEEFSRRSYALLLTEAQPSQRATFQRVGITEWFFLRNLQWFDDAEVGVMHIV